MTATLAEDVAGIREIQSFARQDVNAGRFAALVHDHARYNMGAARHGAIIQPLLEFNGQLFLSLVLVVGGYQALVGGVPLRGADAVPVPVERPVRGRSRSWATSTTRRWRRWRAPSACSRCSTRAPTGRTRPAPCAVDRVEGGVDLDGVGFAYDPGRPVLSDVDLGVRPGRTVALVGATGSGKSTLASLVAKLYLPTAGQIAVDGRDLAGVSGPSLRRHIACVTQNNFLFSGTVVDNIRVGRPDASDAEVRAAARALDVEQLIDALPGGFAAEVGEGGARLSLGQRQIVCFARAMLADPRILLLDEATSSVDVLTEMRMQAALARLRAGRTSFVVAHRLATVRHADEIVVLDHGRIVERGTHASLLAANGAYARTFRRAAGCAVTSDDVTVSMTDGVRSRWVTNAPASSTRRCGLLAVGGCGHPSDARLRDRILKRKWLCRHRRPSRSEISLACSSLDRTLHRVGEGFTRPADPSSVGVTR